MVLANAGVRPAAFTSASEKPLPNLILSEYLRVLHLARGRRRSTGAGDLSAALADLAYLLRVL